jgi:hypothetical protein
MRLLLTLITLFSIELLATDKTVTCQSCHPIIYNEFQDSFHKKSSIKEDVVHKAVWEKHPAKAKGEYKCAKCHTPQNEQHEGMSCISCHTITDVEEHAKSNKNIYETKAKTFYSAEKGNEDKKVVYKEVTSWFGLFKKTEGSPYHDIDYTNKNYYTGKVCMGCHSHKQNAKGFDVCKVDMSGAKDKENNCIGCHMPQVKGSSTTIKKSATHAFHGFAGVRNAPKLLAKHIDIAYNKTDKGFEISIENKTPHKLLTHPLRVVELQVTLKHNGEKKVLKKHTFVRIIGTEGKPSMPWLATEIIKDNMIKAQEKRVVPFEAKVEKGDEIEAILGYYIVNPKVAKKLGLENEKKLINFTPLKHFYYKIK